MSDVARRGWCPGALRPMRTGDGFLLRLRIAGGALTAETLFELAALSESFGAGVLELTTRANLQLRGVAEADLRPLQQRLFELDLLDADVGAESARNVVSSPLAGFDYSAILDARPIVSALEDRLATDTALHGLPGKFSFLVDGGGALALTGVAADIRLEAFATTDGPRLALRLADIHCGSIAPEQAADAACAAAHAFLALRRDERRMAELAARVGAAEIRRQARLADAGPAPPRAAPVSAREAIGVRRRGATWVLGVAAPFGSFRAADVRRLVEACRAHGAREVRLTPWRALILPGLEAETARPLGAEAAAAGWIVDPSDLRLSIAACVGKPACARAAADVRTAALRLAPQMRGVDGFLHVSGCRKGCARNETSKVMLIASPDGFDLVEDGRANDPPARRGLALESVEDLLKKSREEATA
jgi:precorrin-3B synthase